MSRHGTYSWNVPHLYLFCLRVIYGFTTKTPTTSPESISLKKKTIVSQCPYYRLTPWMVGTFLSCCLYGAYAHLGYIIETKSCTSYHLAEDAEYQPAPTNWQFHLVNEPGRITFICNPALSPPTVLLQLYIKCHTASLRLSTLLVVCWQGASAVAYLLYPQSQDKSATRKCGLILPGHMYTTPRYYLTHLARSYSTK